MVYDPIESNEGQCHLYWLVSRKETKNMLCMDKKHVCHYEQGCGVKGENQKCMKEEMTIQTKQVNREKCKKWRSHYCE